MDRETRRMHTIEQRQFIERCEIVAKLIEAEQSKISLVVLMAQDPTPQQTARRPPRVGRNDPCPCGSGKKFKRCCMMLQEETGK